VLDCKRLSGLITQHLIDQGRRRIFYISGPLHLEHENLHYEGYLHALKKNGLPFVPELVGRGDFLSGSAYAITNRILQEGLKIDAIQASNDQAAIGAVKALKERGVSIPRTVAVCGYDDLFPSTLITPAITTVVIPRYEMGVKAVQEVLRRINDHESKPRQYRLKADIVIRSSSLDHVKTDWNLNNW
jgi:DNA-binding LacI/PurR family transcriptional regulator